MKDLFFVLGLMNMCFTIQSVFHVLLCWKWSQGKERKTFMKNERKGQTNKDIRAMTDVLIYNICCCFNILNFSNWLPLVLPSLYL